MRRIGAWGVQFLLVGVVLLATVPAYGQTVEGRFTLSGSYVFETFDEFWKGRKKSSLPDDIHQHTVSVGLEYGLLDDVALDLTLGYTRSSFGSADDIDGLNDTSGFAGGYSTNSADVSYMAPGGIIEGS